MARILIVDDDENLCEVLNMHFADEGFGVVEAQDGQDALDLMQK